MAQDPFEDLLLGPASACAKVMGDAPLLDCAQRAPRARCRRSPLRIVQQAQVLALTVAQGRRASISPAVVCPTRFAAQRHALSSCPGSGRSHTGALAPSASPTSLSVPTQPPTS